MIRFPIFMLALAVPGSVLAQAGAVQSIARAQIVTNAEAEFARVDANKDGQMSRAEIEASQRAAISARIDARNKALFAQLDTDKNGQLSPAEFAKASPAAEPNADAVLRIDTNKDGQVSLDEHRKATIETFTKIDANKDGKITAVEVKAASEK